MSDFYMRRLQHDDIIPVKHIVEEAFASASIGEIVTQTMVDYCNTGCHQLAIEDQPHQSVPVEYWVVVDEYSLSGLCGIYRFNWAWEKSFWVAWFAIAPTFQKQGLGRATLSTMAKIARAKGCEVLKVETALNGKALGFYEHFGFKCEGIITKHYGPITDAAILSLELQSLDVPIESFQIEQKYPLHWALTNAI